jgi:hypothetical protein
MRLCLGAVHCALMALVPAHCSGHRDNMDALNQTYACLCLSYVRTLLLGIPHGGLKVFCNHFYIAVKSP